MRSLIDANSIIVQSDTETLIVSASDPTYPAVRSYLVDERGNNFDTLRELIEGIRIPVKAAVADALSVVDGDEGSDYRIEHGDPVEDVVLTSAVRIARDSGSAAPLGRFLQRLESNPSQASRSQLFGWLKAGGFTITADGMIVGYKSVRSDGLSSSSGREQVTIEHQDGHTETATGRIPYPVGATVSMARELVDDNRDSACSVGLHVGTFGYARDFAEKMLVVLVDPADVVSVPTDCNAQKMRVSKLIVAAEHDGEQISDAVIDVIRTVPDADAAAEYEARPENYREPQVYDFYDDEDDADYEARPENYREPQVYDFYDDEDDDLDETDDDDDEVSDYEDAWPAIGSVTF